MWRCKECGEEVIYIVSKIYKVKKNLKKKLKEVAGGEYWCQHCGSNSKKLEKIAEWVEE